MRSSLGLGKVYGIPLRIHFTWFIIFLLIVTTLITLPIVGSYQLWYRIIFSIIGSLLLFVSILAHELAHSLLSVKNGIPVRSITLFIFGGVSQLVKDASRPKTEILIAIVGPLTSIVIAAVFHGIYSLLFYMEADMLVVTIVQWLAYINALMAMFNLIPGFPLDGGRILRAIIWMRTNNYVQSTRKAARVGRIIGFVFIAGGLALAVITQQWLSSIWLAVIGWFLETSATASYRDLLFRDSLQNVTARDMMTVDCPVITMELSLEQLVRNYVLPTGRRCFLVAENGKLEGLITLRNIKAFPQEKWDSVTTTDAMAPLSSLITAAPDRNGLELLEEMEERNMSYVPVMEDGNVIGLVTLDNIMHLPQIRSSLKV
jgi:Zn-dependent protease